MKEIYLAGGCFWGLQKFFDQFEGVISTEVGYANGPEYTDQHAPSYEEVCRNSGHAETVKVVYDENLLPLPELLRYYFMVIDPVSVNRQGNDCGIQYRTSWSLTRSLSTGREMTAGSSTVQGSTLQSGLSSGESVLESRGRSFCFRPPVSRMCKGTETKGPSPFFTHFSFVHWWQR